jgi:hypothetical protein
VLATRTYQITTDDLKRLHLAVEAATLQACSRCDTDLCDDCQKDANLLQQLTDALSVHSAGVDIILTTQLHSAEKAEKGTIH